MDSLKLAASKDNLCNCICANESLKTILITSNSSLACSSWILIQASSFSSPESPISVSISSKATPQSCHLAGSQASLNGFISYEYLFIIRLVHCHVKTGRQSCSNQTKDYFRMIIQANIHAFILQDAKMESD
jgi:hypothetical protein